MTDEKPPADAPLPTCGIVMPIGKIDNCGPEHWLDVREILSEAIASAGFRPRVVSDSEESGIIHERIVRNLYNDPIAVVDVSAKNPNVMFELGLRLAFDKPTIVVKDNLTDYSFDTSPIEHLGYPRDLRHKPVVAFKVALTQKIVATVAKASDPEYSTFVKHFGPFSVAKIDTKEVGRDQLLMERLDEISRNVAQLSTSNARKVIARSTLPRIFRYRIALDPNSLSREEVFERLAKCDFHGFTIVDSGNVIVSTDMHPEDAMKTMAGNGLLVNGTFFLA